MLHLKLRVAPNVLQQPVWQPFSQTRHAKHDRTPYLAWKPWTLALVVSYQSLNGTLLTPLAIYFLTLLTNRSRVAVSVAMADVQICQSDIQAR